MTFLRIKAAKSLSETFTRLLREGDCLDRFLGGTSRKAEGGIVLLPFGVGLPLADLVDAAGGDCLRLWRFRSWFGEGRDAFDAELACRGEEGTPMARACLKSLFTVSGLGVPRPRECIAAFAGSLTPADAVDVILSGLRHRDGVDDGFVQGPNLTDWMDVLAGSGGWTPTALRALLRLEGCLRQAPDATLSAIMAAANEVAQTSGGAMVFAALHALHVARRLKERGRAMADADRQAGLEEAIRRLPGGAGIVSIGERLSALPTGLDGGDCVWDWLGEGTKEQWRLEMEAAVEGDRDLVEGLAELLLSSAEKAAYEDVEPLLAALLADEEGAKFVAEMTRSTDGLTGLRAAALQRSMLRRGPARRLSRGERGAV